MFGAGDDGAMRKDAFEAADFISILCRFLKITRRGSASHGPFKAAEERLALSL